SSHPPAPLSASSHPPAPLSASSHPPAPSLSFLQPTSSLSGEGATRPPKRQIKECRKHRAQKIFPYQGIVDRRVINGKEEVKVMWTPCSKCGKVWNDTWEPAQQYA
ncbi:hypothetical protein PO909_012998, partial [Leuciscus waleckii]